MKYYNDTKVAMELLGDKDMTLRTTGATKMYLMNMGSEH